MFGVCATVGVRSGGSRQGPGALWRARWRSPSPDTVPTDLSHRELAKRLAMKQPQVARLELGGVNPSMETLMRASAQLGIEYTIDVRRAGR